MADRGKSVPGRIQFQDHFTVCVNELHTDNQKEKAGSGMGYVPWLAMMQ